MNTSPLAPAFERMARMKEELYLNARLFDGTPPKGDGWVSMRRLMEDADFLREQLALIKGRWDLDNRGSAIGVVGNLVWQVGGAAIFVYATGRRVPDLSPENIALRLADGDLEEVAFTKDGFAALADDPASESAALTFKDEDGLRDHLRRRLEGILEPVITEVRAATKVGKRTMWNRAADLAAQRLLQVGEITGDRAWCGREAEKLIKEPGSPFKGPTGFFTVRHEGRKEIFLVRGCCCHGYKDPEHGYCGTCPLLPQDERERRAVEELAGG